MTKKERGYEPFVKPWRIVEHSESFEIQDAAEQHLAYVYFEDEQTRRRFMRRLAKDDARKMAEQILRLPQLVRIARGLDPEQDG
ncbi:hypothetical protein [Bradyrhizobium sp. NAS96.2]|uniref:hypothetical protein n=1 Tax=Bradyrhizobium sp. NAS96.2 TaxID=1680160 RepID=UPI00093F3BC7|nr:hypothetical protein [Bradyrhizobium sp. NAS96.2]OKO67485.1 hypothetical protein AC628_39060 [Bradyrhizobium sp. NAS96.2]